MRNNGFGAILEDGTPKEILRWRSNGFKIVVHDDDGITGMVQEDEETSKRKGDDITAVPLKMMKND